MTQGFFSIINFLLRRGFVRVDLLGMIESFLEKGPARTRIVVFSQEDSFIDGILEPALVCIRCQGGLDHFSQCPVASPLAFQYFGRNAHLELVSIFEIFSNVLEFLDIRFSLSPGPVYFDGVVNEGFDRCRCVFHRGSVINPFQNLKVIGHRVGDQLVYRFLGFRLHIRRFVVRTVGRDLDLRHINEADSLACALLGRSQALEASVLIKRDHRL